MGQYSYSDDLSESEDGKIGKPFKWHKGCVFCCIWVVVFIVYLYKPYKSISNTICHEYNYYTLYFIYLFTDFLLFLKSRQKKASTFEARNNRTNVIDDELFDEGSQRGRMKKVSFLETYANHSHLEDAKGSDSHEYDPVNLSGYQQKKLNNLFSLQTSSDNEDADRTFIDGKCASVDPEMATLDTSRSSVDPQEEETITPLPLDNSETEPPGLEEQISSALEESCQTPQFSAPDLGELSLAGVFTLFSCSGIMSGFNDIYSLII